MNVYTIQATKWRVLWQQRVTGLANLTNSPRAEVLIEAFTAWDTFAVRLTAVSVGTLTNVRLRFGFSVNLAAAGITGPGVDLIGPLASTADTLVGSVGYAPGAAYPAVAGNENSILPPVCRVYITAPGINGRDFTYQILGTELSR